MNERDRTEQGQKLLTAVERIVEDSDSIIARVEDLRRRSRAQSEGQLAVVEDVAERLIGRYSDRSAISGGLSALPAVVPGFGTLATVAGGTLVDMGLMLKFEVEMCLALSWLYGFDIRQERERQIALLMASVSTYDAKSGRNFYVDLARAEAVAIWNYAPRELSKLLLTVMSKLALLAIGKGVARAIPLVGVVIGSGVNKVLTRKVGKRCKDELARRRELAERDFDEGEVVDAVVLDKGESGKGEG